MSSRNKEPPAGYLVDGSPNDDENGTLSCPHHGCDGMAFDTAEECREHDRDWHAGPYRCVTCKQKFATRPAVVRHETASGHGEETEHDASLLCTQYGCSMEGIEFSDQMSFLSHSLESSAHQGTNDDAHDVEQVTATEDLDLVVSDIIMDNTFTDHHSPASSMCRKRPGKMTVAGNMAETTSEDSPADSGFMCLESCCQRYEATFSKYASYMHHLKTNGHVYAQIAGAALYGKGFSQEELDRKREALRQLLCDVEGCTEYGRKFTTNYSFFHHIELRTHKRPNFAREEREAKRLQKLREKEALPTICTVEGCPMFQYRFPSPGKYQYHLKTIAHLRAVSSIQYQEVAKTPESSEGFTGSGFTWSGFTPLTPSTDRSFASADMPSTPLTSFTSPPEWRVTNLERQNQKLEERIRELEAELEGYRARDTQEVGEAMGVLAVDGR